MLKSSTPPIIKANAMLFQMEVYLLLLEFLPAMQPLPTFKYLAEQAVKEAPTVLWYCC
jgi:hypothetical protein